MGHRSVWIVILVALLTATRTATSYSHEEVPRPKALSGLRLNFHLSQTSEESTDSKPVCEVRIRSCTPGHMPPRHKPPTATLLLTLVAEPGCAPSFVLAEKVSVLLSDIGKQQPTYQAALRSPLFDF
jgi:hypothetical protein